ncbi:sigma-E factor negative regulatory protein [Alcanivorax quisquiliarum]|uniref:Sigma-E factor negative regulatory protein n=1 Tax=Alcanivorax quisquiliarum TaxID=2933565 RepID=A0ABT0E790_9GAMM|nr:sigma-E factor negative regulatory protein [Alcanivorax quisquiliarum]MCK0537706.1 sigma-E factor negative regulatory protein [Alcanivorax quisquiliarum]
MNIEREREVLSSLLDGETSELETRRILRDLDDAGAARWARWQLAGDILRHQEVAAVPADFNARLNAALADEKSRRSGWLGGVARAAVAASVAAATVTVGWQYWGTQGVGEQPAHVAAAPVQPVQEAPRLQHRPFAETALVGLGGRVQAGQVQQSQHLSPMLMRHSEFTARHSSQGMVPYARLVSADARQGTR